MKIISHRQMPKKYFDICETRRCRKGAKHLIFINSETRDHKNEAQEYAFCDKHFEQFKKETAQLGELTKHSRQNGGS